MSSYPESLVHDIAAYDDSRPAVTQTDESRIATLAYQLWLERGCPFGSDQCDWFRAETILKSQAEDQEQVLVASA